MHYGSICSEHQEPDLECERCRVLLAEDAKSALDAVTTGIDQETMPCLSCGLPVRVHKEPMSWSVECSCGWSACGSGPPKRKN